MSYHPAFRVVFVSSLLLFSFSCRTTSRVTDGNRAGSRVNDVVGADEGGAEEFPIHPAEEMNVVAEIPVGGDWMCVGFGSLWELSGGKIVRVNPETHAVIATIPASGNFCHPAPDGQIMWVASVFEGKLKKIDVDSGTILATFSVPITSGSEGSFAVTAGSVWVITNNGGTQSGTLTRVDTSDGHVIADIKISNDSHGIAAEGKYIWVTSASGNSVTQVDPETNAVAKVIPVETKPRFISGGEHGVWTLCQGTGNVAHINPDTGELVAMIKANSPGGGGGISAGEGSVWTTTFTFPVTQLDPVNNKMIIQYEGGDFGDAINAGAGYVWVSGGHLSQIKPAPAPVQ